MVEIQRAYKTGEKRDTGGENANTEIKHETTILFLSILVVEL